jgi:hypothetical protein
MKERTARVREKDSGKIDQVSNDRILWVWLVESE